VIVAQVGGPIELARRSVEPVAGVRGAEVVGDELVVTAADGAATIGGVAVALAAVGPVHSLMLRTPTLDDVFLELTGNRMQDSDTDECEEEVA
jgi:ABC-2 type transport system ATP-binding protein